MGIKISISVQVEKPIKTVWESWTNSKHITKWNFASDDWQCPSATNDAKEGAEFSWRMEAKDGSMGFDFCGTYTKVEQQKLLEYTLGDDRFVTIEFIDRGNYIELIETFEAEDENSAEQQKQGWQSILNNFKKHTESISD